MIVHFAAASITYEQNLTTYRKIIRTVFACNHKLSDNYDETTQIEMSMKGMLDDSDLDLVGKRILRQLDECDVAIFDVTNKATFGIGYETAIILAAGKPCLLLLREGSLRGALITGLQHPMIVRREFTDEAIERIITDFLKENSKVDPE